MRRIILIVGMSGLLIVSLYLFLRAKWATTPKKILNILVVDKTVSNYDRTEHKSLFWLLNNKRFVLPNSMAYNYKSDYYGFFPVDIDNEVFEFKSVRINEVDAFAAAYEAMYLADCYGVYSFEWYKEKKNIIRSQKIYGGLTQNDYLLMRKMLEKGKLVIAEHSLFGAPTNSLTRSKTESLLGVNWLGWAGKYFETLNVNEPNGPPEWMKNLYEAQHKGFWPENAEGIVLVSNDGLIELLQQGIHLKMAFPMLVSANDIQKKYGVTESIAFDQWFEFVNALGNEIVSSFYLNVNPEGQSVLNRLGLTSSFAAVIKGKNQNYYYFCGDFTDNPCSMFTAKLAGGATLNGFFLNFTNSQGAKFFRKFYSPLVENILNEYYTSLSPK